MIARWILALVIIHSLAIEITHARGQNITFQNGVSTGRAHLIGYCAPRAGAAYAAQIKIVGVALPPLFRQGGCWWIGRG